MWRGASAEPRRNDELASYGMPSSCGRIVSQISAGGRSMREHPLPPGIDERRGQHAGARVGLEQPEKLQALARRAVRRQVARHAAEALLGPERGVERRGRECAAVRGPGDELPERIEVRRFRARRIVVMRGAVMHVGGDPHHVADAALLERLEQAGDLELAAQRRAAVAVGDRFVKAGLMAHDQPQRHVGRHDLPCRRRARQRVGEPGHLRRAQERGLRALRRLRVRRIRPAVAAHVEREDLDERAERDACD